MAEHNRSAQVKKVQPYPFDVTIEKNGIKGLAAILKLVPHGMLIDIKSLILIVSERVAVDVVLPVGFGAFRVECKVIKTYDHVVADAGQSKAVRIAELHFVRYPLPEQEQKMVKDFLAEIKQIGHLR